MDRYIYIYIVQQLHTAAGIIVKVAITLEKIGLTHLFITCLLMKSNLTSLKCICWYDIMRVD